MLLIPDLSFENLIQITRYPLPGRRHQQTLELRPLACPCMLGNRPPPIAQSPRLAIVGFSRAEYSQAIARWQTNVAPAWY
jgi:hypothetical protein